MRLPTGMDLLVATTAANSSGKRNWKRTWFPATFKDLQTFLACNACWMESLPMILIACWARWMQSFSGTPCFTSSSDKVWARPEMFPDPHATGQMQHVPSNTALTKLAFIFAWQLPSSCKSFGKSAPTMICTKNAMAAAPHRLCGWSLLGNVCSTTSWNANCCFRIVNFVKSCLFAQYAFMVQFC